MLHREHPRSDGSRERAAQPVRNRRAPVHAERCTLGPSAYADATRLELVRQVAPRQKWGAPEPALQPLVWKAAPPHAEGHGVMDPVGALLPARR